MMLTRLFIAGRAIADGTRRQVPLDLKTVRCVLTSELTRLGDVLTTIPALRHLRSILPDARIVSIVDERFVALLQACDVEVEPVGATSTDRIPGMIAAIRTARRHKPDLALSFSPARRNAALVLGSGAPKLAGYFRPLGHFAQHLYRSEVEAQGFALSQPAAYDSEHLEQRAMHVVGAIGGYPTEVRRMIAVRASHREQALDRLRVNIADSDCPFILLHPFAGWQFREWPVENFVSLGKMLLETYRFSLVFLGERSESPALRTIMSRIQADKRVSVFSSDDLVASAVLMEKAALFVGSDSGPLHLAAMLGTPVVGLFGPSTPALTGPLVPRGELVYEKVECSPCAQTTCLHPEDHCMRRLTPAAVLSSIDRLLHRSQVHQMAAYGE